MRGLNSLTDLCLPDHLFSSGCQELVDPVHNPPEHTIVQCLCQRIPSSWTEGREGKEDAIATNPLCMLQRVSTVWG